jgi:FtsP/CotA-like multicopper oxidase with cupredoxin domain
MDVDSSNFSSPVIAINGKWPSPVLRGNINDTLIINVHNDLGNQSLSLHWHGIHMTGNNKDDGVPMVTQCPISPGTSYAYTIHVCPDLSFFTHTVPERASSCINQEPTGTTVCFLSNRICESQLTELIHRPFPEPICRWPSWSSHS